MLFRFFSPLVARLVILTMRANATTSYAPIITQPPIHATVIVGSETSQGFSSPQTDCDGNDIWTCSVGTCYSGVNGYIGCCLGGPCLVRTTCYDYDPTVTTSCDTIRGGCMSCSVADTPYCLTSFNELYDQYFTTCAKTGGTITVGYTNRASAGSMAGFPIATSSPSQSISPPSVSSLNSETYMSRQSLVTAESPRQPTITTIRNVTLTTGSQDVSAPSLSTGTIVGIAIASAVITITLLFFTFWWCHKCGLGRRSSSSDNEPSNLIDSPFSKPELESSARIDRGLGIAEFEGSIPGTSQSPWAPASFNEMVARHIPAKLNNDAPSSANTVSKSSFSPLSPSFAKYGISILEESSSLKDGMASAQNTHGQIISIPGSLRPGSVPPSAFPDPPMGNIPTPEMFNPSTFRTEHLSATGFPNTASPMDGERRHYEYISPEDAMARGFRDPRPRHAPREPGELEGADQ